MNIQTIIDTYLVDNAVIPREVMHFIEFHRDELMHALLRVNTRWPAMESELLKVSDTVWLSQYYGLCSIPDELWTQRLGLHHQNSLFLHGDAFIRYATHCNQKMPVLEELILTSPTYIMDYLAVVPNFPEGVAALLDHLSNYPKTHGFFKRSFDLWQAGNMHMQPLAWEWVYHCPQNNTPDLSWVAQHAQQWHAFKVIASFMPDAPLSQRWALMPRDTPIPLDETVSFSSS